jgi:hypothetical protein
MIIQSIKKIVAVTGIFLATLIFRTTHDLNKIYKKRNKNAVTEGLTHGNNFRSSERLTYFQKQSKTAVAAPHLYTLFFAVVV